MLAEAERTCGELQRAACRLEGRLAELAHWSTESLDCHQHLKEKQHSRRSALGRTAKVSKSLCNFQLGIIVFFIIKVITNDPEISSINSQITPPTNCRRVFRAIQASHRTVLPIAACVLHSWEDIPKFWIIPFQFLTLFCNLWAHTEFPSEYWGPRVPLVWAQSKC